MGLTGLSQWMAERRARRANQGIFSGLFSAKLGTPYNPNMSVEDSIRQGVGASNEAIWGGGSQIPSTLGELSGIHAGALDAYNRNWDTDMARFGSMGQALKGNLADYGTAMRVQAGRLGAGITGAWQTPYRNAMGYANQIGIQQQADIRQNYANLMAQQQQQLGRQGLGATTIGSSMRSGATRLQQADLNRLAESLAGMKIGIEGSLGTNLASAKERAAGLGYDVESALASQQRGLADWRAQTGYGMGQQRRWGETGLAEQQAREMLDTKNRFSTDIQNLIYAPSVTAADQSGANNASYQYGYSSVAPYQPKGIFGGLLGGAGGALGGYTLGAGLLLPGAGFVPGVLAATAAGAAGGYYGGSQLGF